MFSARLLADDMSWFPGVVAGVYGLVPQAEFLISLKGMVQVRV